MRRLFLSISAIALLSIPPIAHSGWTYVSGNGRSPKADCLEMRCQYGCIEDDTGHGKCCSAGSLGDKCYDGACACKKGTTCQKLADDTYCLCQEGTQEYTRPNGQKDCCNTSINQVLNISNGQACCPKDNVWDEEERRCVECINDNDCTDKGTNLICSQNKTCGCPDGKTEYTDIKGLKGCCLDATPFWNEKEQRCVECLGNYNTGYGACSNANKPWCNTSICKECPASEKEPHHNTSTILRKSCQEAGISFGHSEAPWDWHSGSATCTVDIPDAGCYKKVEHNKERKEIDVCPAYFSYQKIDCNPQKINFSCQANHSGGDGSSSCTITIPASYSSQYDAYVTGSVSVNGYPRKCWTNGAGLLVAGAWNFNSSGCGYVGRTYDRQKFGPLNPGAAITAYGSNNNGNSAVNLTVEFVKVD